MSHPVICLRMARSKSEDKRLLILHSSKSLFSQKGFFNTSISDIVRETGLPVGTIYNYFKNKEEIVRVIVEEGWTDLVGRLEAAFETCTGPSEKLRIVMDQFLPELFKDLDLISIFLAEAVEFTRIEEKIDKLTNLIFSVLKNLSSGSNAMSNYTRKDMKTALVVYFLGILNAVRLSTKSSINLSVDDIMHFVKLAISESLGVAV
ncbi:MAG: TetR/AcrR family transcriptional regulator [Spirochaetales bacterium]|nr:MAG: TetR/AcrR family transcriptional regulator [Spirochaetales bacterium]